MLTFKSATGQVLFSIVSLPSVHSDDDAVTISPSDARAILGTLRGLNVDVALGVVFGDSNDVTPPSDLMGGAAKRTAHFEGDRGRYIDGPDFINDTRVGRTG